MDSGNVRWFGGADGGIIGGAVVIGAAAVVSQGAVGDVVSSLPTLEAGVVPLAVVHQGTLVVEFSPVVSLSLGRVPRILTSWGLRSLLVGACGVQTSFCGNHKWCDAPFRRPGQC